MEENGLRTETLYDTLERTVETRTFDGRNIIERSQTEFDDNGRSIASHNFFYRTPNDYVRQTTYFWYDNVGRMIAEAQYGCGSDLLSSAAPAARPQTAPERSTKEYLVTQITYDPLTGKTFSQTDQRGITSRVIQDALERPKTSIANYVPNGAANDQNIETKNEYDGLGRIVVQIDPLGHAKRIGYDALGRVAAHIDEMGNRTTYTYDLRNSRQSRVNPHGHATDFGYDHQRRLNKTIQPAPAPGVARSVQRFEYDSLGRVVKNVDPLGNETLTVYDDLGQVAQKIDANGGVTAFTYNTSGKLLTLTDPVGNTTSHEYDARGRLIKETNALDKSRHFEYHGQWLVRKTDRNGRVIEYVYDRFGRMKEERWLEGNQIVKTIAASYNEFGDLVSIVDDQTAFTYEYDSMWHETKSTMSFSGLEKEIALRSEYDKRSLRSLYEAGDFSTRYTYTPARQMESIASGDQSVAYAYNAAGQRVSARTPAVNTSYAYDGMGRLTQLQHGNVAQYSYTWDAASRIIAKNDGKYGYDKTNQLTSAVYDRLPAERYQYDPNGNRSNYTTGKNNQLLNDGRFAYQYDDEGNRVARGSTKYTWDHRNRLVKVETPEETVDYVYDHSNRLVKRVSFKESEYFVHDGWQIIMILDGNGSIKERFLWGANQDELIATDKLYALCDHLGTVRTLVDATGNVVSRLEYSAFGELISSTGMKPRFRYTVAGLKISDFSLA